MNIRDDFILKNIHRGYLVGGYVRDILTGSGLPPQDRDIAIKDAEKFAKELAEKLDATFIVLDSENKIYRIVLKDKENYLDISELRGVNIEEDLSARDFTINAIAYNLETDDFIDVVGGIEDIKLKRLCIIKEQNIIDDPLRILRAYRFMATTGFKPDEELISVIKKHMDLINLPAKERIHDEIMKLFGGKYTSDTLLKMLDDGILELIFPCVSEIKKIPPNSHHHLDLIHHVIETVRQIELQFDEVNHLIPSLSQKEREFLNEVRGHLNSADFGGYPRINHLKLVGFLHDIGKPSTWTLENAGKTVWSVNDNTPMPNDSSLRHRFIKHDINGAKMVIPILKELKFSNKQIDYISGMIKNHIYPSSVIASPTLDSKVMMRYVRKMGENVIDNILLAKADRFSAQGTAVTKEMTEANISGLNKLLEFYLEVKPTLKPLPKLIDGNEIMELLGIDQSPKLGEIIAELKEAQLDGNINTKDDAINFVLSKK